MELLSMAGAALGVPTVDLVRELSTSEFHRLPIVADAAALLAHLSIGVSWAVFYAFFFWGRLRLPPALQGLIFAALPATLAIFVVYPELTLMRAHADVVTLTWGSFFAPLTLPTVVSLLVAHLLFGLIVGAIYRRPVGYAVNHRPTPPARRLQSSARKRRENSSAFMFATGIECSYPTIDHGRWRRDEMDSTRHYELWQDDFRLAREIGITHIRDRKSVV